MVTRTLLPTRAMDFVHRREHHVFPMQPLFQHRRFDPGAEHDANAGAAQGLRKRKAAH